MSRLNHIRASIEQAAQESLDNDLFPDARNIAQEISTESLHLQQLSDIADGLEELVYAAESIKDPSPTHLLLLEAGVNLALAGTTQRAEDLSPALESRENYQASLEGVRERISQIIEMIKRYMKELWMKISDFFTFVSADIAMIRHNLSILEDRCDEYDGRSPTEQQVSIGQAAYGVATEIGGVPVDAISLSRSLEELRKQMQGVRTDYVPTVLKIGDGIHHVVKEWTGNPGSGEAWLNKLNLVASAFNVTAFGAHMGHLLRVIDVRYPNDAAHTAAALPGCRSLVFVDGNVIYADKSHESVLDRAITIQSNRVDLIRLSPNKTINPDKAVMRTMSVNAVRDILRLVDRIVEEAEAGIKSRLNTDLLRTAKDLGAAAEAMGTTSDAEMPYLRRGLGYCTAYSQWAPRPYIQLLSHSLVVSRAALRTCSRHLAAYRH